MDRALLDFVTACLDAEEAEVFGEATCYQPYADDDAILSADDWRRIVEGNSEATAEFWATIQAGRRAVWCHEQWCRGDCTGPIGPDPSYYEAIRIVACIYSNRPGFQARWRTGDTPSRRRSPHTAPPGP